MTAQRWQTETYYASRELRELMFASLADSRGTHRPGQPGVPTCSTGAALPVLSLAPRSAPVEPTYTLPDHCTECGRWRGPDPEAA